jgi:hypothetical protein
MFTKRLAMVLAAFLVTASAVPAAAATASARAD